MSDDKRLGANPLSWVDPNAVAGPHDAPVSDALTTAVRPGGSLSGGLFMPAETLTKEDFMGKGKIKLKQTLDTSQAAAHLMDLAESLVSGIVRAKTEEDSIVLHTGETIEFEMKISRKKDKAKCSIEMEWKDDGSKAESFKISG